jgi:D-3-phosphoglycerate dehydrogenase
LHTEHAILPDAGPDIADAFARHDGGARVKVFTGTPDHGELLSRIGTARTVVLGGAARIDAGVIAACPSLAEIVFLGTGAAAYVDLLAAEARAIRVHTIRGYGNRVVAEHTIALLFAVWRDIAAQDAAIRAGGWSAAPIGELAGKTLGLIGLGAIGAEVARCAHALGMTVLGWARRPMEVPGVRQVDLDTLLEMADAVSLHLAHSPQTEGFLDAGRLRQMKRGAILINTARAELTDEAEILAMLHDGHLAGAGLDVLPVEPPVEPVPPLLAAYRARESWLVGRLIVTPHSAFHTPAAYQDIRRKSAETMQEALISGASANQILPEDE